MGRDTKLTPERSQKIVDAIRLGNYAVVACQLAGVDDSTFYRWMEKGEDKLDDHGKLIEPDPLYRDFRESVRRAEAEAEALAVRTVVVASRSDPNVAIKLLERRWPKRWRQQYTAEVTGSDGGPIAIEIARTLEGMTDAELDALKRSLADGVAGVGGGGGAASGQD
jgi:hypothetical protein